MMQQQQTPRPAKQTPFERFLDLQEVQKQAKPYSRGYNMCCPVHNDTQASLIFWEDEQDGHVGIHCFANCQRVDICQALGIREADLYKDARPPTPGPQRKLDLLDLAVQKFIPPAVFINAGMEDNYTWKQEGKSPVKGVVRIPYMQEDGSAYRRSRIRTAISAGDGSYWEGAEAPLIPYGLWRLQEARDAHTLWIVEGESDCWTQWLHGIPTLGIPGAGNTKVLEATHLREIDTLYVVQEPPSPGKKSDAGKQFIDGLCVRLKDIGYQGDVFAVSLQRSLSVKDPNDLHKQLFVEKRMKDYAGELQKAIHEAVPLDLTATRVAQPEQLSVLQPLVEQAIATQDSNALYELASRVALLPTKEQATVTTLLKQGMRTNTGFSQRAFNKLVKESVTSTVQQAQHVRVTNKPDIQLSGDIEEDARATLFALYSANVPPMLFIQSGKLVRCRINEKGKPFVERIDEPILQYEMAHAANFLSYNQAKGMYLPTYPPAAIARHILSERAWNFPALKGITEVPIIREDGTLLNSPGYDAQSRMIYMPHPDLVIPPIPLNPTKQELDAARDLAWSYIAEFPYETRADAANAFALVLTTVTRSLYSMTPLAIIDATKQGSGKGLLSKAVAYIAQGRSAAAMIAPSDENEWRKTLTAQLVEGNLLLSLDNIEGILHSSTLASFLTADVWSARLLGTMQSPELEQNSMMMANGNNLQLGGDLPRRSYRIRMDAGVSQPWMRPATNFTYNPLLKYVKADRGKIIAALLTMVRAWYAAGQPAPQTAIPTLSEFSGWSDVIGGILDYAEVEQFLGNLAQLYSETDTDGPQWTGFLEMWETVFGNTTKTTGEIIAKLKEDPIFATTLPESLAELPREEPKEVKAFSIKLGRALQKRNGTPYGPNNMRIRRTENTHTKQKLWNVVSVPVTAAAPVRLVWSRNAQDAEIPTPDAVAFLPNDESVEQEENTNEDQERREPVMICEAPNCERGPDEEDAFGYDTDGNAWCSQHESRKQFLENGARLERPFARLRVQAKEIQGRAEWTQFCKTADDVTFTLASNFLRQYVNNEGTPVIQEE